MISSRKDFINSVIYSAQSVVAGFATILLYPIITSNITPEVFGVYALAMVYASLITGIANLGCVAGFERNYFIDEGSSKHVGNLLGTVQLFVGTLLVIVFIIGWITQEQISELFLSSSAYSKLWWFTLVATGFSSIAQYYLTYLKNEGRAGIYFKTTIVQVVVNFILVYYFFTFTNYGVLSLAYAFLASNLLLCGLLLVHQLINLPFAFNKDALADLLKISIPLTPKVLFGFFHTQADKILLSMFASMGSVGIYTVAQRIALSVFSFTTSLDRVFKPNVYRMLFSVDGRKDIGSYLVPFIYISIFPALIIVLFSPEIISLLVADDYSGSAGILIILCLYYASLFFGKISGTQLIYAKKTWLTSKLMFLGIFINIAISIPMILYFSALGAALATTLTSIIMTVVYYLFAQKYASITWEFNSVTKIYALLLIAALYILAIELDIITIPLAIQWVSKILLLIIFVLLGRHIGLLTRDNYIYLREIIRSSSRDLV